MSTPVIQAEGLGKLYRRAPGPSRNDTLRDALTNFVRSPLAALRSPQQEAFWALRGVSFRGPAAARCSASSAATARGRATLLKILSRITEPTTGRAGFAAASAASSRSAPASTPS